MYRTCYRCNTASQLAAAAADAGLPGVTIQFVTNGPTWLERFPILFEMFHVFHLAIRRSDRLRELRCALVGNATKPARDSLR